MALEWTSWMGVARSHLRGARNALESEDLLIVVQIAHQVAEESLKALWVARTGELAPRIHALVQLAVGVDAPDEIQRRCRYLAPLYTASRYPDAINSDPLLLFDHESAQEALETAEDVFDWCLARAEEVTGAD